MPLRDKGNAFLQYCTHFVWKNMKRKNDKTGGSVILEGLKHGRFQPWLDNAVEQIRHVRAHDWPRWQVTLEGRRNISCVKRGTELITERYGLKPWQGRSIFMQLVLHVAIALGEA